MRSRQAEKTETRTRRRRLSEARKQWVAEVTPYVLLAMLVAQVLFIPWIIAIRNEQRNTKTRQLRGTAVVCAGQLADGVTKENLPDQCLTREVAQYYDEDFVPRSVATQEQLAAQALKNRQVSCIIAEAVRPDVVAAFERARGEKCADPPRVP